MSMPLELPPVASAAGRGRGAVACGHPETAAAARRVLDDGGNAFDATLAAMLAACVAEPVLASLGGGGFLLARPAGGEATLYDFFVETPLAHRRVDEIEFYPVTCDFGTATQEFHIGLGAMATPGVPRGLFAVHADLASRPMTKLAEPAVRLARDGFVMRDIDAFIFRVVAPILVAEAEARARFVRADGDLLHAGDRMRQPALAGAIEALAREGDGLFYEGELGRELARFTADGGGQVTREDLARYRVERRRPLARDYRGTRILTNPPPSTGGLLISFALNLLARTQTEPAAYGSPEHLGPLARVMEATNRARVESRLHEAVGEAAEEEAAARLLAPDLLARYAAEVAGRPATARGTTHISVVDAAGNVAAVSLSNGEGCGHDLPGTGIMLNNVLGEEDLNPAGFHRWPAGSRVSSMMAPTLAFWPDGSLAALGSGGSNRLRTAILQVLVNLIDFGLPVAEAVAAPRAHVERGILNLEAGYADDATDAAAEAAESTRLWTSLNLYFGGVHAVMRGADGHLSAAGDPRRGGAALVV